MKATTREWIEKAEADYVSAGREYRARNRPNFDAACFFALGPEHDAVGYATSRSLKNRIDLMLMNELDVPPPKAAG